VRSELEIYRRGSQRFIEETTTSLNDVMRIKSDVARLNTDVGEIKSVLVSNNLLGSDNIISAEVTIDAEYIFSNTPVLKLLLLVVHLGCLIQLLN